MIWDVDYRPACMCAKTAGVDTGRIGKSAKASHGPFTQQTSITSTCSRAPVCNFLLDQGKEKRLLVNAHYQKGRMVILTLTSISTREAAKESPVSRSVTKFSNVIEAVDSLSTAALRMAPALYTKNADKMQ